MEQFTVSDITPASTSAVNWVPAEGLVSRSQQNHFGFKEQTNNPQTRCSHSPNQVSIFF